MIILHQFPPAFDLPNASPFCMKLELYLRMAGLPYRNRYTLELHRAPKGKLPWIDDDGTTVADSGFIIEYLKGKYGDPLDGKLDRCGAPRDSPSCGCSRSTCIGACSTTAG